jgi:hypothetical protein
MVSLASLVKDIEAELAILSLSGVEYRSVEAQHGVVCCRTSG